MPLPPEEISNWSRARDNCTEAESVRHTGENLVPESSLQIETWRYRQRMLRQAAQAQAGTVAVAVAVDVYNAAAAAATAGQSHDVATYRPAAATAVATLSVENFNLLQPMQILCLSQCKCLITLVPSCIYINYWTINKV